MRWIALGIGAALVCAAPFASPTVSAAQKTPVTRALPFERLTGSRVKGPTCPDTSEVCKVYSQYIQLFRKPTLIPDREKELLILRTGWLSRGDQIWGRHAVYGKESGMSDEEIARVPKGPDAPGWNEIDAALLRAVDELHMTRFISNPTWNTLAKKFSEPQLVEIVLIVGDYTQMAMYQNTTGSQRRQGDPPLPPDGSERQ